MSLGAAIYRLVDSTYFFSKGFPVTRNLRFLTKNQWCSQENITSFQNCALQRLIAYAYEFVPYYRRIMDSLALQPTDIRTISDIAKLPTLSKEDITNNWQDLISKQSADFNTSVRKTGGSTGRPIQVLNHYRNGAWELAAFRRGLGFGGYKYGERIIELFGGTLGSAPQGRLKKWKRRFSGVVFLPAFEIGQETLRHYVQTIKRSRAKYLRGYASATYLLAKLAQENNLDIYFNAVFPTAEMLYDFQRDTIERAFRCQVFNQYGCGECNSIGFECPSHSGLHVSDEHVLLEVLKDSVPAPAGQMGAATITTLQNYAMPLIRYQNGDILSITKEPCPCGRGLSRIIEIHGRANDLLRAQDGRLISGAFIPHLFRETEGIKQVQVIQQQADRIILKVVKGKKFSSEELQAKTQVIRKYMGDVHINVEYVSAITASPQGKLRFVISSFGETLLNTK